MVKQVYIKMRKLPFNKQKQIYNYAFVVKQGGGSVNNQSTPSSSKIANQ